MNAARRMPLVYRSIAALAAVACGPADPAATQMADAASNSPSMPKTSDASVSPHAAALRPDGAPTAAPHAEGDWRLVWSDEFYGPAGGAVDRSQWTFDVGGGGWGNGELQNYTDRTANAALDGAGSLVITAQREDRAGHAYTSARLLTRGLHSWQYGRFEARMQLPSGPGLWPAFWLLGDDLGSVGWPACGEIDAMEHIGREPAIVHGTLHGPGYSGIAGVSASYTLPAGRLADGFRVFAVEWELGAIRWYIDDKLYASKTPADIPSGGSWVFAHPFFIIVNVAVGGAWPGPPDARTTFPQRMLVDYVRVYQR